MLRCVIVTYGGLSVLVDIERNPSSRIFETVVDLCALVVADGR